MKESDFNLVSAIITLTVCGGIAFFVCNLLLPKIEPVTYKTVDAVSGSVESPSSDIFNFTAINPTVEVYVGSGQDETDETEPEPEEDELEEEE